MCGIDGRHLLAPRITIDRQIAVADPFGAGRLGELHAVAMPEGPNVADIPENLGLDHGAGVSIQHAVMPLMADGEHLLLTVGRLDHVLALLDVPGH